MNEIKTDFSACIVAGGEELRKRVENAMMYYAPESGYFDLLLEREDAAFEESACGFLLLDSLLQKHRVNRAELVLERSAQGRPFVASRSDIDFSISHSEGCALCAVALGEGAGVGADIQRDRGYSDEKLAELAKAFMTETELSEFRSAADRTAFFYRTWTRHEACLKRGGGSIFGSLADTNTEGELFEEGVITACGGRYYYSINRAPERSDEE